MEGSRNHAYRDSEGYATVGIGFNLHDLDVRMAVYSRILEDYPNNQAEADYLNSLNTVFDAKYKSNLAFKSALNAVTVPTGAVKFSMNDTQISDVFDGIIPGYEDILASKVKLRQSYERLALISLTYNNPSLIGPGLLSAVKHDNRAEAWYEIRFGSNKNLDAGIEARRYYESDVFGVYQSHNPLDSMSFSNDDALQLLTTRSRHINTITSYLDKFGEPVSNYTDPIVVVNSSESIFTTAIAKICDKYGIFASDVICDYKPIVGGVMATEQVDKITCDKYDVSSGVLILAGNGNNVVTGSSADDTIYVGKGNDRVLAGRGFDTIHSSGGVDRLNGGPDSDTYVISFKTPGPLPQIVEKFDDFSSRDVVIFKDNPAQPVVLSAWQNVE